MWDEFGSEVGVWGADSSYNMPSVPEVAQTNVFQGAVDAPAGSDMWTGFFQDTVKGLIGYATARDALQMRSQYSAAQNQAAYRQAAVQQQGLGGLLPLMLIGGFVFLIAKD